MKRAFFPLIILCGALALSACQPVPPPPLELARFTENSVEVVITLTRDKTGQAFLSASFHPLGQDFHLYSKDIPRGGVSGVGRPALIELPADSSIKPSGDLVASAAPQSLNADSHDIAVYPAGAVTLTQPIILPDGKNWVREQVIVTYMVCTQYACRPPVEGKMISIQIPQNEAYY